VQRLTEVLEAAERDCRDEDEVEEQALVRNASLVAKNVKLPGTSPGHLERRAIGASRDILDL
jgi:hypothetical protein